MSISWVDSTNVALTGNQFNNNSQEGYAVTGSSNMLFADNQINGNNPGETKPPPI
jgi:parallel beta-helix repeat protein